MKRTCATSSVFSLIAAGLIVLAAACGETSMTEPGLGAAAGPGVGPAGMGAAAGSVGIDGLGPSAQDMMALGAGQGAAGAIGGTTAQPPPPPMGGAGGGGALAGAGGTGSSAGPGGTGGLSDAGAGGMGDSAGAAGGPAGAGGTAAGTGTAGMYDYADEMVALDTDLVIAGGDTLRVGPGTTFAAASGVEVLVEGSLVLEGTLDAKIAFVGGGVPRSWHGIVVAGGGTLTAAHVEISGATYGIHAQPGSSFSVDHADIGTSFKAAVVESDGSFDHTRFHASGDPAFSAVSEVSIDDVNGTLTILDASPTVSNSTFDGSAIFVDMIRVGGRSAPVFDHVHIKEAHCGIHSFGAANNMLVVRNSIFELLAYGLMAYATKPVIENSVFLSNGNDIGYCFEATQDNAPVLTNNFYSSGTGLVDPSCFQIGTADSSPAATANPEAGPMGL